MSIAQAFAELLLPVPTGTALALAQITPRGCASRYPTNLHGIRGVKADGAANWYIAPALAAAEHLPARTSRVTSSTAAGLLALHLDLDVDGTPDGKGGVRTGHAPTLDDALELAHLALAPTAIVYTGGGIQPWWIFDVPWIFDGDRLEAAALSVAWQNYHRREVRWHIDSTHDLARLLRLPGSLNVKDPDNPRPVTFTSDGSRIPVDVALELVADLYPAALEAVSRTSTTSTTNGELPMIDLEAVLADQEFGRIWRRPIGEGERAYPSESERDYALACSALRGGWDDEPAMALVAASRIAHDAPEKGDRPDYLARTIANAHAAVENGSSGRPPKGRPVSTTPDEIGKALDDIAAVDAAEAEAIASSSWVPLVRVALEISRLDRAEVMELEERLKVAVDAGQLPSIDGLRQLRKAVKDAAREAREPVRLDDDRPRLVMVNEQLHHNVRLAVQALAAQERPTWFVRGGELVHLTYPDREPMVAVTSWAELKQALSQVAAVVNVARNGDETYVDASDNVVRALAKHVGKLKDPPLPVLEGIIEAPSMRPNGSIITTPGYDATTGYYYHAAAGFQPEHLELDDARTYLLETLKTLHLDDASRTNLLALELTGIVRPGIAGLVPMCLLNSPAPGAGKTSCVDKAAIIATGRYAPTRILPESKGEAEKVIFSALLGGRPLIAFDDVTRLDHPAVTMALTSHTYRGRLLGFSRDAQAPNRAIWTATACTAGLVTANARRCYLVQLEPPDARPWETKYARQLLERAIEERPRIVGALLALIENWRKRGCPDPPDAPPMGQFSQWVRVVGGILAAAELGGILENRDRLYDAAGDDGEWCEWWHAIVEADVERFTVRILEENVGRHGDPIADAIPLEFQVLEASTVRRFGHALGKRVGVNYKHSSGVTYRLERAGTVHGALAAYRIRVVEPSGD